MDELRNLSYLKGPRWSLKASQTEGQDKRHGAYNGLSTLGGVH